MRALRIEHFGEPSELQLREIPRPVPGQDEVLVQVIAAAVNPSDIKNAQGLMPQTTLPRTPGRDFAGIAVEGPDSLLGKEVWGSGGDLGFTRDGAHTEYLVLPASAAALKPASLSIEAAAAVGVAYITAWTGLLEAARMVPGETVLVIGGAGSVGSAVAQIARWKGASVLATIRSAAQEEETRRLHDASLINLEQEEMVEAARRATGGKGIDIVFNTVGGPTFEPGLAALGVRGRQIVITATRERQVSLDLLDFYRRELRLLGVNTLHQDAVVCAHILEQLAPGFESGALRPPATQTYRLQEAVVAYERVLQGTAAKVLLLP
jgi:NADPH:quinone reductase-like Zn-dependent oxidoreductase